jgi:hypothetical protein
MTPSGCRHLMESFPLETDPPLSHLATSSRSFEFDEAAPKVWCPIPWCRSRGHMAVGGFGHHRAHAGGRVDGEQELVIGRTGSSAPCWPSRLRACLPDIREQGKRSLNGPVAALALAGRSFMRRITSAVELYLATGRPAPAAWRRERRTKSPPRRTRPGRVAAHNYSRAAITKLHGNRRTMSE